MSHFGLKPAQEPEVFINGVKLNFAQSMTLRVAISGFRSDMLEPDALGGSDIAPLYAARAREIEQLMFLNLNRNI